MVGSAIQSVTRRAHYSPTASRVPSLCTFQGPQRLLALAVAPNCPNDVKSGCPSTLLAASPGDVGGELQISTRAFSLSATAMLEPAPVTVTGVAKLDAETTLELLPRIDVRSGWPSA